MGWSAIGNGYAPAASSLYLLPGIAIADWLT
jgi:hypothetical protein